MSTVIDTSNREAILRIIAEAPLSDEQKAYLADKIISRPVPVVDTRLRHALDVMDEAISRARISDSWRTMGYRAAMVFAAYSDYMKADARKILTAAALGERTPTRRNTDEEASAEEHVEWVDNRLGDIRAWLHEDWQAMVDTRIGRDDMWRRVERVIKEEVPEWKSR